MTPSSPEGRLRASAKWFIYKGLVGGPDRDRTDDLFHAMEARSQLRHRPTYIIVLCISKNVNSVNRFKSTYILRWRTGLCICTWVRSVGGSVSRCGGVLDGERPSLGEGRAFLWCYCRRPPNLPHSCPCSTIGPARLNFRVRDGNGCSPRGIFTGKLSKRSSMRHARFHN